MMRQATLALPILLMMASCSGCSDTEPTPVADTGPVAPGADTGSSPADAGPPPVVPPEHPILGTWAFDSDDGSGVDGISFYIDGTTVIYSAVAQCNHMDQGTWTLEGDQLTITIGEQPPQPQTATVTTDRLEIATEGMPTMVLLRAGTNCDKPTDTVGLKAALTASWRVEGQGERGHILSQMNRYVRSDNIGECAVTEIGEWDIAGSELRIRVGEQETVYQVSLQEDGNFEMRTGDGSPQRWLQAEENCERRPVDYNIIGTWTASVQTKPALAFTMDSRVKSITDLAECTEAREMGYFLTSIPPQLIMMHDSREQEAETYTFEIIDADHFKLTRNNEEIIYTRDGASCHGQDAPQDLDYAIIGTWESADQGAFQFAFAAQGQGQIIESAQSCAMTEIVSYRVVDSPPRLELVRDAQGVPNPDAPIVPEVYEFREQSPTSFSLTKDGVTWNYTRSGSNCHSQAGGPEPIDYPIQGTWESSNGSPALALNQDQQGRFGQYVTSIAGCVTGEGFSFNLSGDPATMVILLDRNGEMVRLSYAFRRIDDNSFVLQMDGQDVTFSRSQTNCHSGGEEQPLDYEIIGTWGTQAEGHPPFVFKTDNVGNLGHELSTLEGCVIASSFSYRLIAQPPTLERLYTNGQGEVDARRHALRVIDANSFGLAIEGQEIVYTRLRADCHTRDDNPPPPPEINPAQLIGTWAAAQGTSGYAFAAQNRYKNLSNLNGCAQESAGSYELVGNLLTLNPGQNERPLFFVAAMNDDNSLRLTDDNRQTTNFTRSQTNCHGN